MSNYIHDYLKNEITNSCFNLTVSGMDRGWQGRITLYVYKGM